MSFFRMIVLGTYLAGAAGLALGIAIRVGLPLGTLTPRGALLFAGVCFLCTLATSKVAALLEKPKEERKTTAAPP